MKKIFVVMAAVLALLCAGCASAPAAEPTDDAARHASAAPDPVPEALTGTWSSADSGQLDLTETFTFSADGTLSASAVYRGAQTQTVTGTFTVSGHTLYCEITGGVGEPYTLTFDYRIDGRELYLTDSDGESQFLRVS